MPMFVAHARADSSIPEFRKEGCVKLGVISEVPLFKDGVPNVRRCYRRGLIVVGERSRRHAIHVGGSYSGDRRVLANKRIEIGTRVSKWIETLNGKNDRASFGVATVHPYLLLTLVDESDVISPIA